MTYKKITENGLDYEVVIGKGKENDDRWDINKDTFQYQDVLDDFSNAHEIRIATYSFTFMYTNKEIPMYDILSNPLGLLNDLRDDQSVWMVICPEASRSKDNKNLSYDSNAKELKETLDNMKLPANFHIAFSESNHAKIISTENIAYVGSANFTQGSMKNFEAGVIIRNKGIVKGINSSFQELWGSSDKFI